MLDASRAAPASNAAPCKVAAGKRALAAAAVRTRCAPRYASCLREWQRCVVTPGQRALLGTKRGARYGKSLRQLALAEYGCCFGGRCEACAAVHSDPERRSEVDST